MKPKKPFDAIEFKDEMQRLAQARLAGLSPAEQAKRRLEHIMERPLGEWWASLPRRKRVVPKDGGWEVAE